MLKRPLENIVFALPTTRLGTYLRSRQPGQLLFLTRKSGDCFWCFLLFSLMEKKKVDGHWDLYIHAGTPKLVNG